MYKTHTCVVSQNRLSKPLQASNTPPCIQNKLSELLQVSYTLCGSQNGLSELHNPPTRFAVVKMDSPNLFKPSTRLELVKTDSQNLYKPPIHFWSSQNTISGLLQCSKRREQNFQFWKLLAVVLDTNIKSVNQVHKRSDETLVMLPLI